MGNFFGVCVFLVKEVDPQLGRLAVFIHVLINDFPEGFFEFIGRNFFGKGDEKRSVLPYVLVGFYFFILHGRRRCNGNTQKRQEKKTE